jgi:hypothetical protein
MGQVLHGSATACPRASEARPGEQRTPSELQYSVSYATAKELAERNGINPKTVAK